MKTLLHTVLAFLLQQLTFVSGDWTAIAAYWRGVLQVFIFIGQCRIDLLEIRLGYLIEIHQMRPKNCPNFQNFSENQKCALIFFENFSKNRKKPSKKFRLRRKIAKCALLLPKNAPFVEKGFPKVIKSVQPSFIISKLIHLHKNFPN